MTFPQRPRRGSRAHIDALRDLDEARDHQHDTRDALDASLETPDEQAVEDDLACARGRAATRETWLVWLERGF